MKTSRIAADTSRIAEWEPTRTGREIERGRRHRQSRIGSQDVTDGRIGSNERVTRTVRASETSNEIPEDHSDDLDGDPETKSNRHVPEPCDRLTYPDVGRACQMRHERMR